jgi:tRNA-specific 2-thiouridylase
MKGKIAVGLSGGVDSSVTAALLQEQGYEVVGVFLKIWDMSDPFCPAAVDAEDARSVAHALGIPFYTFDFSQRYKENVFSVFLEENKKGRTPNPDILCNTEIKFGGFVDIADELGCSHVATGHYAEKRYNEATKEFELVLPVDAEKDQTYFLHGLTQKQLARAMFPLGGLQKSEVRSIAKEKGFITAAKKDSVGICMVGDREYRSFLEEYLKKIPGEMQMIRTGQVVGQHQGLSFYTLGQRKQLGIGGVKNLPEMPFFVVKKDFKNNVLVVSQEETDLDTMTLKADMLRWVSETAPVGTFTVDAKVRYRTAAAPCEVRMSGDIIDVTFMDPVRAVTPGQSVVLYDGDVCLGGGVIM